MIDATEAYANALTDSDQDMGANGKGSTIGDKKGSYTYWGDIELWDGSDQTAKGLKATVTITNDGGSLAGFNDKNGLANGNGPDVVIPLSKLVSGKELKNNTTTGNLSASNLYVHCYLTIKGTNTKNYISIRDQETTKAVNTGT